MERDDLFGEIQGYLDRHARQSGEEVLLEGGILLLLLVKRGITTRQSRFVVRPDDPDRLRLILYLFSPGLAPNLAEAELAGRDIVVAPNWPRLAEYFTKSVPELEDLLSRRIRRVLERNWPTIAYLLSRDNA